MFRECRRLDKIISYRVNNIAAGRIIDLRFSLNDVKYHGDVIYSAPRLHASISNVATFRNAKNHKVYTRFSKIKQSNKRSGERRKTITRNGSFRIRKSSARQLTPWIDSCPASENPLARSAYRVVPRDVFVKGTASGAWLGFCADRSALEVWPTSFPPWPGSLRAADDPG